MSRAVRLIKAVSSRSLQGWRLTDLAAFCGFDTGSAHRMLAGLVRERLIEQRRSDRHYLPGPLLFELGLGVPRLAWLAAHCAPALADLVRTAADGYEGVGSLYYRRPGTELQEALDADAENTLARKRDMLLLIAGKNLFEHHHMPNYIGMFS